MSMQDSIKQLIRRHSLAHVIAIGLALVFDRLAVAADPRVFVYAAGGYYRPDDAIGPLLDEMRSYLDRGYTMVKMKIGGAPLTTDLRRIEAVLGILGPGQRLAVDANGRFDLPTALAYANALRA